MKKLIKIFVVFVLVGLGIVSVSCSSGSINIFDNPLEKVIPSYSKVADSSKESEKNLILSNNSNKVTNTDFSDKAIRMDYASESTENGCITKINASLTYDFKSKDMKFTYIVKEIENSNEAITLDMVLYYMYNEENTYDVYASVNAVNYFIGSLLDFEVINKRVTGNYKYSSKCEAVCSETKLKEQLILNGVLLTPDNYDIYKLGNKTLIVFSFEDDPGYCYYLEDDYYYGSIVYNLNRKTTNSILSSMSFNVNENEYVKEDLAMTYVYDFMFLQSTMTINEFIYRLIKE